MKNKSASGTFALNKGEPIHRWYPYLEGYSSCLIKELIEEIGKKNINNIYDPFCGTGTTCLVASSMNIPSVYSETNPFMQMVIETKINSVINIRNSSKSLSELTLFFNNIKRLKFKKNNSPLDYQGFEKFYDNFVLHNILNIKDEILDIDNKDVKNVLLVLLASIVVRASKMIRQGDLRVAKTNEKKSADFEVLNNYIQKVEIAIDDIENKSVDVLAKTSILDVDARNIKTNKKVNCIITSPPYLNGTNYIRNTKLELKLCDFINSDEELPEFHAKGIVAGINNVSKKRSEIEILDIVVPFLKKLEPVVYDERIPKMISGYFFDMDKVINKLSKISKVGTTFIMDIGDSQFAGIHIPTHKLLTKIAGKYGFILYDEDVFRKRRSKNGMVLSQRLLKMRKKSEKL